MLYEPKVFSSVDLWRGLGSSSAYNNNVAATLIGLHQSVASGIKKCGHV